jgi:hypothetical protein
MASNHESEQLMKTQFTQRRVLRTAAVAVIASVALIGGTSFAEDGGDRGPQPEAPAGTPVTAESGGAATGAESAPGTEAITTSGSTFDATTLTKFIPARSFVANQGPAGGALADETTYNGLNCLSPGPAGVGSETELYAGVELPDGAQITLVRFFGVDTDATRDITVSLDRVNFNVPLLFGSNSRTDTVVTSFTTSAATGSAILVDSAALTEDVGTPSSGFVLSFNHRFHSINVRMINAAGTAHALCGVEVFYKVPVAANPGVVFFPITPFRAFDSRDADYGPAATILAPGGVKTISIADGHDLTTGVTNATNLVPAGATAITYNITITGATGGNFVAVTPGDATTFGVSTINFNGVMDVANGATVGIDASRQIKLFGGAGSGSVHVIVDVTGYYAAYSPPNMGN